MKLIEFTRSFYPSIGGMEKFVAERLEIYSALKISFQLVTTDHSTEKVGESNHLNVIRLKQFSPYNIAPEIFLHFKECDVVSINYIGRFYSDIAILKYSRRKTKIILTPCFSFHTERLAFVKNIFLRFIFPILLAKTDAIIAFTEHEKKFWMSEFGIDSNKIFVISPYVDLTKISSKKDGLLQSFSVPFFLYIGRFSSNKKTELLISTFIRLQELKFNLYLTIRKSDVPKPLRELAEADKRIHFMGFVDEEKKRELLEECSAVVFPTTWESFGYVAFEAASYKKPLLCSDIPVFRELLNDQGTIFFDNTEESLSDALLNFSSKNENERKTMGEANYQNSQRFTFESSVKAYMELFKFLGVNIEVRKD